MNFDDFDIMKFLLFAGISTAAMIYAYASQWVEHNPDDNLWHYLTGNKRAVFMSFGILTSSWFGTELFSFLDNCTTEQLAILAYGVGIGVPAKYRAKLAVQQIERYTPQPDPNNDNVMFTNAVKGFNDAQR